MTIERSRLALFHALGRQYRPLWVSWRPTSRPSVLPHLALCSSMSAVAHAATAVARCARR